MADELRTPSAGNRRSMRSWVTLVALVLALIFIFRNSQHVDVKFLFWTMNIPLIFALLLAAALGFIVGLALPRLRRHD